MLQLFLVIVFVSTIASAQSKGSCAKPIQDNLLYIGAHHNTARYHESWTIAQYVCCHNSAYAENWGFLQQVKFFEQLTPQPTQENPWIFYDSTCGKPLFKAPVGRTFEEWKTESIHHGWPSFHDEESFLHNLKMEVGGEVKSVCGTHLGHNIPDTPGVNRYCIDLVCIAGQDKSNTPTQPSLSGNVTSQSSLGSSYCTYSPDYGCFKHGWPSCCGDDQNQCPVAQPDCDDQGKDFLPSSGGGQTVTTPLIIALAIAIPAVLLTVLMAIIFVVWRSKVKKQTAEDEEMQMPDEALLDVGTAKSDELRL